MSSEVEKLVAVAEVSQQCGAFVDWLRDTKGFHLCQWMDTVRSEEWETGPFTSQRWHPVLQHEGYYPTHVDLEALLAEFFGIDLQQVERERRALLESLWASQSVAARREESAG